MYTGARWARCFFFPSGNTDKETVFVFHPHSVGLSAVQGERLTEYSSIMKNKWSDSSVCVHSNLCAWRGFGETQQR